MEIIPIRVAELRSQQFRSFRIFQPMSLDAVGIGRKAVAALLGDAIFFKHIAVDPFLIDDNQGFFIYFRQHRFYTGAEILTKIGIEILDPFLQ